MFWMRNKEINFPIPTEKGYSNPITDTSGKTILNMSFSSGEKSHSLWEMLSVE